MQAPLFSPGSAVWIRRQRWRLERISVHGGVVRLDVAGRDRRLTFLAPFDRPAPARRGVRLSRARTQQALARLAGLAAASASLRTPRAALHARVTLLPHQFDPLAAVLDGARRVLIADEVGLGKTIQAGLVLAELRVRDPSARILVAAPASLRSQWAGELERRFGLRVELADRQRLASAARSVGRGENAWQRARLWIVSLDFLKQPHVAASLPRTPWDLVVIDEAHEVCGDSERHAACEALLGRARRVLLLTATPHSGDVARFNRLLRLGALPGIEDPLTMFRRTRADLGWTIARAVRWTPVRLPPVQARVLEGLASFEQRVLAAAGAERRDAALLFLSVLRKRALSTMAALGRTIQRRLDWLAAAPDDPPDWVQPRLALFDEVDADDLEPADRAGLTAQIGLDPRRERAWLARLAGMAAEARRHDAKPARVEKLLRRSAEPVVVFTEFRDSLDALQRWLPHLDPAVLHGAQTQAARAAELDRFLSGRTRLLLATDVASQGLNLQERARWVISLELPWNPARLAQRLGRVDRIGQPRRVHATLLVARHEAEAGVLRRLSERALAARQALDPAALQEAAPPDHLAVAAALLDGKPLRAHPALPLPATAAVRHRAVSGRAIARLLARKRRLATRWRGAAEGSPFRATLATSSGWAFGECERMAIFSTPIVNDVGVVIELHYLALGITGGATPDAFQTPECLAQVAGIARTRLRARLARLRRILEGIWRRQIAVDRAIAVRCARPNQHAAQPGLFAPLRATSLAAEARALDDEAREERARRRAASDDLTLAIASPVLEALLERRPR